MKKYVLSIEIDKNGDVRSTETASEMTVQEVIGLLEMQKKTILDRLSSTHSQVTIDPRGLNNGEE